MGVVPFNPHRLLFDSWHLTGWFETWVEWGLVVSCAASIGALIIWMPAPVSYFTVTVDAERLSP